MNLEQAKVILSLTSQSYNAIASDFSASRANIWPALKQLLSEYIKTNDSVLDIGCGNGRIIEVLPASVKYFGVDNSANLIKAAEEKYQALLNLRQGNVRFTVADILEHNFPNRFPDGVNVVCLFAVLNHLPSEELRLQAFKNIVNVLKPGGKLLMTNWNLWRLTLKNKSIWKYKIFNRHKKPKISVPLEFGDVLTTWKNSQGQEALLYYHAFTKRELKRLLQKAGFKIISIYYENHGHKASWFWGRNLIVVAERF